MSAQPQIPVNNFNGTSDDARGAEVFGKLWEGGAFEPTEAPKEPAATPSPSPVLDSPTQTAAVPTPAEPEYTDLSDFLTKSQLEEESFYKLPVPITVDGNTEKVPLSELLRGYQREADYTRKTQMLAEQRRQHEAERAQAVQAIQAQINQAQTLGNLAHQQLLGEYQSIDWNRLRAEDPTGWAVKNQEFNNRAAQIQQHLAQVQQQQQYLEQQRQTDLVNKVLPAEREKLLQARPEWRDDSQFQAARATMVENARKLGFSDAELAQVHDHRYLIVLDLASRYLGLQAQAPAALKQVRTAPPQARPGARQNRDPQVIAKAQAKEAFLKNRRDPDAQARYFDTLA